MARLQYLLSTLHEGRYRSPCKTRFRLAAGLYREGVEPSGALRKVSDSGYIVVLLPQALPVASWMHARRGFERAYVAGDARGGMVLTLVQKLYAVERQAQQEGLSPEAHLGLRLSHSLPVYAELFGLLEQWAPHVPTKTPLGKAIAYASNRSVSMGRFLEDGRLPVDNGEVERLIKLIVIGRKNWLFLGSDAVGHRAASVYSLVLSCYHLGMDPWAWLRDVLPKLGDTRFPAVERSRSAAGETTGYSPPREEVTGGVE